MFCKKCESLKNTCLLSLQQIYFNRADYLVTSYDISYSMSGNNFKDEGMLIFDANGDEKPDIYIASGSYQFGPGSKNYQNRLYINEGNGMFALDAAALPQNYTSKLCVRAVRILFLIQTISQNTTLIFIQRMNKLLESQTYMTFGKFL